jgi:hypothetical protein
MNFHKVLNHFFYTTHKRVNCRRGWTMYNHKVNMAFGSVVKVTTLLSSVKGVKRRKTVNGIRYLSYLWGVTIK